MNCDIRLPVASESATYSVNMSVTLPTNASHHILCLPGILETGAGFHALSVLSKQSCAMYALDYSGRGESDYLPTNSDYRMSHCVREAFSAYNYLLGSLRTAESGKSHIHLIGNSTGGLIAILLALHKPSYVRSIVINDVGYLLPWSSLMGLYGALGGTSFLPGIRSYSSDSRRLAQKLDVDTRLLSSVMRPDYLDIPHQKTLLGISLEEQFLKIQIPVLILHSSDSQLLPESVIHRMRSLPENFSFLEVAGNTHPVSYTDPIISVVQKFIEDAETPQPEKNRSRSSFLSFA